MMPPKVMMPLHQRLRSFQLLLLFYSRWSRPKRSTILHILSHRTLGFPFRRTYFLAHVQTFHVKNKLEIQLSTQVKIQIWWTMLEFDSNWIAFAYICYCNYWSWCHPCHPAVSDLPLRHFSRFTWLSLSSRAAWLNSSCENEAICQLSCCSKYPYLRLFDVET